ncbi:MAG: undecaprenyl-diphosphate phosphatase [Pseudomonadota bacterium]
MLEYTHAIILGIVEGLTEFLPVSSTGHLILAEEALGFHSPIAKMFTIVIQLGAILAICWLYRAKLWDVATHIHQKPQQAFVFKLFVAFLPAAIIGLLFHKAIEAHLFSPVIVAVSLILGGIVIWVVEKKRPVAHVLSIDDITLKQAFLIGCAQAVAIIPGTSRSGATIIGGLILKLDRKVATEFSFFLAIPIMCAATLLDVIKNYGTLTSQDIGVIAVGFIVSFFAALGAVKFFIGFIGKHDFIPFAIYRIIFGSAMLAYYTL